ncbi:hypothetical protein BDV95DRAFT_609103 [Massariosphaeria phaeospora]|uniref:Uncharacterized protein n=1 Tax=Massariosphaeria phaeospora TaxID=100035 RepID=A0A7C8MKY5_9PLEO|nr:hypothetical protein BDV95DRAFT_609103 [Massariosphaeria phaeospora]
MPPARKKARMSRAKPPVKVEDKTEEDAAMTKRLFGREEPDADVEDGDLPSDDNAVAEYSPSGFRFGRPLSMNTKAIKAREKALKEKFEECQSRIKTELERDDGVIIDTRFLAETGAAVLDKNSDFTHLVKLRSDMPFRLIKQTMLEEGEYAGHVAIIIKQELPFRMLALPLHVRAKILRFALKHDEDRIHLTLKQSGSKTAYAPDYHGRNFLAVLGANKQMAAEAGAIVYGQFFHCPGTQVLSQFLIGIGLRNVKYLQQIHSDTYHKQTAQTSFHLLQEARALQRFSFAHVSSNESPPTAVKNIFNAAGTWLLSIDRNNPLKGLDVLTFEEAAFHTREKDPEGGVTVTQWGPAEQMDFLKALKAKLRAGAKKAWKETDALV